MTTEQSGHDHSLAIRQEIQRFESVHPSIYAIYDLIDLISDTHIAKQIREHVVAIEGMIYISKESNVYIYIFFNISKYVSLILNIIFLNSYEWKSFVNRFIC